MMITRRSALGVLMGSVASSFLVSRSGFAATSEMSAASAYRFSFPGVEGGVINLADYAGKVILVVNTASQCGYSGQFAGLEQLFLRFGPRGLVVIAVPSNDFGSQEPGGAAEIKATAEGEYHVTFPIAAKAQVLGSAAHPFYRWTAGLRPTETPRWNFHKYLIDRQGHLANVFPTATEPTDPRVIGALVAVLGES